MSRTWYHCCCQSNRVRQLHPFWYYHGSETVRPIRTANTVHLQSRGAVPGACSLGCTFASIVNLGLTITP